MIRLRKDYPTDGNDSKDVTGIIVNPGQQLYVANGSGDSFEFVMMGFELDTLTSLISGLGIGTYIAGPDGQSIYTCPDGKLAILKVTATNTSSNTGAFSCWVTVNEMGGV